MQRIFHPFTSACAIAETVNDELEIIRLLVWVQFLEMRLVQIYDV